MDNWKQYICRNCKHWHDYDVVTDLPKLVCKRISTRDLVTDSWENNFCHCKNWESIDNLLYLEKKYEQSQSIKI